MVMALWFLFAGALHGALLSVGGSGRFADTATITLQVFGVIYVLCNIGALIARVLATMPAVGEYISVAAAEKLIYLPLQIILLFIYVPTAVRHPHRLTRFRVASAVCMWLVLFAVVSALFLSASTPMATLGR
jgi:hypothetical protein